MNKKALYESQQRIYASFEVPDLKRATLALWGWLEDRIKAPPDTSSIRDEDTDVAAFARELDGAPGHSSLDWLLDDVRSACGLSLGPRSVKLQTRMQPTTFASCVELQAVTTAKVAVFACHHMKWWRDRSRETPSFGPDHYLLGAFCAISGAESHARLASTRLLDHGPFRVIPRGDTTWLQFYDLDADEETAWGQAHPGHMWLADSNVGGFAKTGTQFLLLKPTSFDPDTGTSIVLMRPGEALPPRVMYEAACAKVFQPFEGIIVQQVAFVFFDEANARKHLHSLWLRGLECRWMSPHGEVRLDSEYHPPTPARPAWVQALQEKEGQ